MWCSRHKSQTTANSIEDIQGIINKFGPPDRVRTDNGPSYRRMFSKWLKKIGATHETTAPYTACSNGFIENGVKCTKGFLRKMKSRSQTAIDAVLANFNSMARGDGTSPATLFHGCHIRLPGTPAFPTPEINMKEEKEKRQRRQQEVRG